MYTNVCTGLVSSVTLYLVVLRYCFSLNLEPPILARWADCRTPGSSCLSSSSSRTRIINVTPHLAFCIGAGHLHPALA